MKTVAFIPIKLNNQRAPGKNLRAIGGVPLVTRICNTALKVTEIDEIYVFCSSPEIQAYLPNGVTWLQRSTSLDTHTTSISEVNAAFIAAVPSEVYVSLMATAPFIRHQTIAACTQAIQSGVYDSAFPVRRLNEFLWVDGKPNYDMRNIPRTQDLPPTFAETTGFYIFTHDYEVNGSRIGSAPFMFEVSKIEATDIDTEEDFQIAEAIWKHMFENEDINS